MAFGKISLVQTPGKFDLGLEAINHCRRQHRHPVHVSLAITDDDLTMPKIHVFHTQPKSVAQTQACTIQDLGNQQHAAAKLLEESVNFFSS